MYIFSSLFNALDAQAWLATNMLKDYSWILNLKQEKQGLVLKRLEEYNKNILPETQLDPRGGGGA